MSFTEFVESPGYKKVMGKVYGLGAAVVILGALWKILHLPGATAMLIAGLGTEAVIFGLSAFEPPHEMPDWSLVYPELVGLEANPVSHGGASSGGGSDLAALIQAGTIETADVEKLSDGIKKLAVTSSQLSNISDASMATESYLQNMKQAGDSVGQLANSQIKSAKVLDESAGELSQVYANATQSIKDSSKVVADSYSQASQSLKGQFDQIAETNATYSNQMKDASKNIGALNSAYELQLQSINAQIKNSENLADGMNSVTNLFQESATDVRAYRQQVELLSKNVTELNNIYGNMLSAMNVGK